MQNSCFGFIVLATTMAPFIASACSPDDVAAYKYVDRGSTWECVAHEGRAGVRCQVNDFALDFLLDTSTGDYVAVMDLQRSDIPIQEIVLPVDPQTCAFTEGTQTIINRGPAQKIPYMYRLGDPVPIESSNVAPAYDSLFYEAAQITFRRIHDCSEVAAEYGFPSQFGILLRGEDYGGEDNFACTLESHGHRIIGLSLVDPRNDPRAIVHLELASGQDVIFEAAITAWAPFEVYGFMNPQNNVAYAWRRDLGSPTGSFLASARASDVRPFDNLGFSRGVMLGLIGQSPEDLDVLGIDLGVMPLGPSSVKAKAAVTDAIRDARPELASEDGYALRFDTITGGVGDIGLRLEDFRVVSCTELSATFRCEFQTRPIIPYRFTSGDRQLLSLIGLDPDTRFEPLSTYLTAEFEQNPDGTWAVDLSGDDLIRLGAYHEPISDRFSVSSGTSGPSAIDCAGSALMPAYVGVMRGC